MKLGYFLTQTLVALALSSPLVHARHVRHWTLEELHKESDCVLIAEAIESHDAQVGKNPDRPVIPVVTALDMKLFLKGKSDGNKLTLYHFRLNPDNADQYDRLLVAFDVNVKPGWPRKQYLMFLRKLPDGRFAPVSGQDDALTSILVIGN
jgi:hypothetical protein